MCRRVLSIFVAFVMLFSATAVFAEEPTEDITVYLSVSRYGEIVKDKSGNDMAYVPVSLSGKDSYCLDDVFFAAHEKHYEGGIEGYASSVGEWGLGVDKFWGDTSYNFGYQVNGGTESVMGPGHIVENGDYIDAAIYRNLYPDTESYAKFSACSLETYKDEEVKLTLFAVSGYDENWNNVFSPCQGATITLNGEATDYVTDENGEVVVAFNNAGEYIVSAVKEKVLNDETRPAIAAPVCIVSVKEHPAIEIIHNIAENYSRMDLEDAGGNLPWIVADMMVYEELYPESQNIFSKDKKEETLEIIVGAASETTTAGDLAKYSLALRAMGYDAKKVYTNEFKKDDIIAKLIALVDSEDESITNIYTLPYVMIALSQADGYATDEQMEYLITAALESKSSWQDTEFGTDALTPMLLALAPYYNERAEVKSVIDETVNILKSNQREDGLIDGYEGYEPASTGLALCALSAVGIDPDTVKNTEISLIDGLVSTATEEKNGFPNAFATEQGFRGLLAWSLLKNNTGRIMYDFRNNAMEEANVSGAKKCPIIFNVSPKGAAITAEGAEKISENCYDLDIGTYTFTISAAGYVSETYALEVNADDVLNRLAKTATINLTARQSSGGGGGGNTVDKDENEEKDEIKEEAEKEIESEEQKNPDPEKTIFTKDTFSDVKSESWYFSAVKFVYENNLFNGTDKGFEPDAFMTRGMLVTVLHRLDGSPSTASENFFTDVRDDEWYTESIKWAAENGIINGVSDTEFAPDSEITREQLATVIFRYAASKGYDVTGNDKNTSFKDFENVSLYAVDAIDYMISIGVMQGKENEIIAPADKTTRAEVATMLMRFTEAEMRK